MNDFDKVTIIILAICAVSIVILVINIETYQCEEYKTNCYYGSRNTHTVDCNATISSVPYGYSIYRERSCIRR